MVASSLIPLARVVFYEVARVEAELGVELGTVRLDIENWTVVVDGRSGALGKYGK